MSGVTFADVSVKIRMTDWIAETVASLVNSRSRGSVKRFGCSPSNRANPARAPILQGSDGSTVRVSSNAARWAATMTTSGRVAKMFVGKPDVLLDAIQASAFKKFWSISHSRELMKLSDALPL